MTEDTDAPTVVHGPADDRAGRGAGVPGPADGLVAPDVVTLTAESAALLAWFHERFYCLGRSTMTYDEFAHNLMAIEATVRADATRAAEAEVAAWRRLARGHCAHACTDEEHGRLLDGYRAALAAQLAAPTVCGDCGAGAGGHYHWCESRPAQPAAPEAEPDRCEGYDLSDRPDLAPNIVCTLPAGHDGFHLWPIAQPAPDAEPERCPVCNQPVPDKFAHADGSDPTGHRAPEAEPERCAFQGCLMPDAPGSYVHAPYQGRWADSAICHPFTPAPR